MWIDRLFHIHNTLTEEFCDTEMASELVQLVVMSSRVMTVRPIRCSLYGTDFKLLPNLADFFIGLFLNFNIFIKVWRPSLY